VHESQNQNRGVNAEPGKRIGDTESPTIRALLNFAAPLFRKKQTPNRPLRDGMVGQINSVQNADGAQNVYHTDIVHFCFLLVNFTSESYQKGGRSQTKEKELVRLSTLS